MSGRVKKQRTTTNAAESATLTLNERILKECHDFYVDPKNGNCFSSIRFHFKKNLIN